MIGIGHGADVLAGDDEDMYWRLGMYVGEGVANLILVNGGRGNGSFNDFAEHAAHGETSVHGRCCTEEEMGSNVRGTRICSSIIPPGRF